MLLELEARIGRPHAQGYLKGHANRLRAMVTGDFDRYNTSLHYDNVNSMSRSLLELSLRFINCPEIIDRQRGKMYKLIRTYITVKYT